MQELWRSHSIKVYIEDAGIIASGRTDSWSIRPSGIPSRSAGSGGGADCLVSLLRLDCELAIQESCIYLILLSPSLSLPVTSCSFLCHFRPLPVPYCPLPVLQIGTWYSNNTLVMNSTSLDLNASETLANKTLIVTTILVTVFSHSARQLVLLLFQLMMSLPP